MTGPVTSAHGAAARAADSTWLSRAARVGLAARGLVYVLIGLLAIEVARGGAARTDQQGALRKIAEQPFGRTMLWLVGAGFLAYGLWRLGEGIWGRREESDEKKRTVKRIESVASGVIYLVLCVTAVRIASGSAGGGGSSEQSLTARLLEAPGGQTILVVIGLVLIGVAMALAWRGLTTDFEQQLRCGEMSSTTYAVVRRLGQVGYVSRGLVVGLVGGLVVKAALGQEPDQPAGLDVALERLVSAPFGQLLLPVAAAGLVCFGVYSFAEVRYRRL